MEASYMSMSDDYMAVRDERTAHGTSLRQTGVGVPEYKRPGRAQLVGHCLNLDKGGGAAGPARESRYPRWRICGETLMGDCLTLAVAHRPETVTRFVALFEEHLEGYVRIYSEEVHKGY